MSELQRLVYASRATFPPSRTAGTIEVEVARILMQSRRHNPRNGLVGALYYSDGHFFQVLEGPAAAVDALYSRLHDDPRHRDLLLLIRQRVASMSFSGWAMKYVPNAAEVKALMAEHDQDRFDPYRFEAPLIDDMVSLLLKGADAALPAPGATVVQRPEPATRSTVVLILAVLAVVIASAALYVALKS